VRLVLRYPSDAVGTTFFFFLSFDFVQSAISQNRTFNVVFMLPPPVAG
jgi:hypothetical protein